MAPAAQPELSHVDAALMAGPAYAEPSAFPPPPPLIPYNTGPSYTSSSGPSTKAAPGTGGFFSVSRYQPYFNVDTSDVFARIRLATVPIGSSFYRAVADNPDLCEPLPLLRHCLPVHAGAILGTLAKALAAAQVRAVLDLRHAGVCLRRHGQRRLLPLLPPIRCRLRRLRQPQLHHRHHKSASPPLPSPRPGDLRTGQIPRSRRG